MKTPVLLAVGLGLAVSCLAWSAEPNNSSASLNPTRLAGLDAMLSVCRDVNLGGAEAYRSLKATLVGRQSDAALDGLERTSEYRRTYAGIRDLLRGQSHEWLLDQCRKVGGER